jgi:hypothetical protein
MGFTRTLVRFALLLVVTSVSVAQPVETLRTDLRPLIKAAATTPVQFAVLVPHSVSARSNGHWSIAQTGSAEWSYAVRIPTAVSLSFHASHVRLPASAVLTVRGSATTVVYRSVDITKSELWSRLLPGESLEFTLSVASSERDQVVLDIQSFQAGYRSLGPGTQDHPYYRKLQMRSAAAGNGTCVQNYQCSVTPANTPIAQATVAIVVGNMYQCTGTLINDVPGDNTPYILTARHCENGIYGGGTPGAAANVTVYWNATTSCGSTLGSIYDPAIVTQSGATTVVEQQDAWLLQLNDSPVYAGAQFAGFDASGVAVQGGYTIHHALGYDDQLTQWFGQAFSLQQTNVLGSSFVSNFLETVNQAGNIGPGASGSGLVDGNNHVVGSLSLGRQSSDPSGYESCPVSAPGAPNGTNGTADFISLARVWSSTADATSSTGTTTLQSVLDPSNSGLQVVASTAAANDNFTASSHSLTDGDSLVLSWNASGAAGCTANDGANGDGWSGALPASGSVTLTESFGGEVKYSLVCQFSGGKRIISSTTVSWYGSVPFVFLDSFGIRWINATATLTWSSNVSPCAITGGGLSLSGLPSSGSTSTTQNSVGDVTYTISCGTSPASTSTYTTVSYITPALEFRATGTDRLIGQDFYLYWQSYADTCIPSGGAPSDGWTSSALGPSNMFRPNVSTAGTYTYNLTCSAGPNQVTQSVTVTLENDAPYTTFTITPTTVTYSASASDYVTISWKSNLSFCTLASNPANPLTFQFSSYPLLPSGAADAEDSGPVAPGTPGDYVVSMTCNGGVGPPLSATSAPVTLHVLSPPPPTVQISTSASTVSIGEQFTINWTSTNAQNCTEIGNVQDGFVWVAGSGLQPSGSMPASFNHADGQVTLGITCQSIDPNQSAASAQTQITVEAAPIASLSVSPTSVTSGNTFTLTWSSTNASNCTAGGGGADGSTWTGDVAATGTLTKTATAAGTFTYSITCVQDSNYATSSATLTVSAATGSGGSSGGKGGGGRLQIFELLALLGIALIPRRRLSSPTSAKRFNSRVSIPAGNPFLSGWNQP